MDSQEKKEANEKSRGDDSSILDQCSLEVLEAALRILKANQKQPGSARPREAP